MKTRTFLLVSAMAGALAVGAVDAASAQGMQSPAAAQRRHAITVGRGADLPGCRAVRAAPRNGDEIRTTGTAHASSS